MRHAPNEFSWMFLMMTVSIPKTEPDTIFWTIGCANTGRMLLRLLSVFVSTSVCVYCSVVGYSPKVSVSRVGRFEE